MIIRIFERSDISSLATILAICNRTDAFSCFITVDIDKYPTSYRLSKYRSLRNILADSDVVAHVVETELSDYDADSRWRAPEVIGFSIYKRTGSSATAQRWQAEGSALSLRVERTLLGLENKYYSFFSSLNPTLARARFARVAHHLYRFDPEIFAESWYLRLLFIHPDWQRKGIGRRLMQWGFDRAAEENVPVVLIGSALGSPAYRAAGFRSLLTIDMKEYYNDLEFGGEKPKVWIWEPETPNGATRGNWYVRAKDKLDMHGKEEVMKEIQIEAEQV